MVEIDPDALGSLEEMIEQITIAFLSLGVERFEYNEIDTYDREQDQAIVRGYLAELVDDDIRHMAYHVQTGGGLLKSIPPGRCKRLSSLETVSIELGSKLLNGVDPRTPECCLTPRVTSALEETQRLFWDSGGDELIIKPVPEGQTEARIELTELLAWAHDYDQEIPIVLIEAWDEQQKSITARKANNPFKKKPEAFDEGKTIEQQVINILLSHGENQDSWDEDAIRDYIKALTDEDRQKFIDFVLANKTALGSITPDRAAEHVFYEELELSKALRLLNGIDPDLPSLAHSLHIDNKIRNSEEALSGSDLGREMIIELRKGSDSFGNMFVTKKIRLPDLMNWAYQTGHPINPVFDEAFRKISEERAARTNQNPYNPEVKPDPAAKQPPSKPNPGAESRKITALEKIALALAMRHCGFQNPEQNRSSISKVMNAIENAGLSMDRGTAKDRLEEAYRNLVSEKE